MRHEAACLAVIGLSGLLIHTVQLNISSRQTGYRIAENFSEADGLRQVIASRREQCRHLLEMDDVQVYVKALGLTIDVLLPPVDPAESYDTVAFAGSRAASADRGARGSN